MLEKLILCITLIVLMFFTSNAQVKEDGFFIDVHGAYNSVGNGFDGERALIAQDDVFAVPNFDSGIGFGLTIGFRHEEWYTELAYQRTEHDFIWAGVKGDAVHSIWSVNVRRLFFKDSKLQPFLQLGWIPVMPIRVHEGALLVSQNISSDAIFIGSIANFNAGGGIEIVVRSKISVRLSILYKRARYVSVESSEENVAIELEKEIKADDFNMTLGVIFVLYQ